MPAPLRSVEDVPSCEIGREASTLATERFIEAPPSQEGLPPQVFRSFGLFRVLGIPVRAHGTLPLFLLLASWLFNPSGTLAGFLGTGLFIVAVLGFVLLHELGHCIAARSYGIRTRQIVLTPIGGIAALEAMPRRPFHEFVVAIAGPMVNFVLAGALGATAVVLGALGVSPEIVLRLALVNLVLGTFNLLPGFPLDGGRIFRALLALRLPYLRATEIATRVGQAVAVALGLVGLSLGHPMLVLIALFVFFAAQAELVAVRARLHPLGALGGLFERMARQAAARGGPSTGFGGPPFGGDRELDEEGPQSGDTIIDLGPDGRPRRIWRRGEGPVGDTNEPRDAGEHGTGEQGHPAQGSEGPRVHFWSWRGPDRG